MRMRIMAFMAVLAMCTSLVSVSPAIAGETEQVTQRGHLTSMKAGTNTPCRASEDRFFVVVAKVERPAKFVAPFNKFKLVLKSGAVRRGIPFSGGWPIRRIEYYFKVSQTAKVDKPLSQSGVRYTVVKPTASSDGFRAVVSKRCVHRS